MSMQPYDVMSFNSRRSPVLARRGMVSTAQPLASLAGMRMLLAGGNAIDAAVAAAAVLGVTEPFQTGLGGDCFALVYSAAERRVHALNASGPAPQAATLAEYQARGFAAMPKDGPLSWTVPGCVDGWCQMLQRFGSMKLDDVLAPAIDYAENGFPVSPSDSAQWRQSAGKLAEDPGARRHLLIEGRTPGVGDVLVQRQLAATLRLVAKGGRAAFYEGTIAAELERHARAVGGLLRTSDLAAYHAEWVEPIGLDYRGHRILQCPPNGQGLATLLALAGLREIDFSDVPRDAAACLHVLIEATKYGMMQSALHVADPRFASLDVAALLHAVPKLALPAFASQPARLPPAGSDTVFLAAIDEAGNAVAFINSIYGDFGSGSMPEELGFMLQNRGAGFSLDPAHPNCLAPGKRPYHTITPGMALREGRPALIFGITGGFLQPQGQVQLLASLLDYGMDVQSAIDLPRFWWEENARVVVEDGLPEATYAGLAALGHEVVRRPGRRGFGGAQIIAIQPDGVRIGGSEPRQDGCAIGW